MKVFSLSFSKGTLFSQKDMTCSWMDEVDCSKSQLFYPQSNSAPSTFPQSANIGGQNGQQLRQPVTSSPLNTQIPRPTGNQPVIPTTPPSSLRFSTGLPSPAMGSLDFGRSMHDVRNAASNNNMQEVNNFAIPPFRPQLFRPSLQLTDPE